MSRRSSSGLVLLFGRHCLKTSSSVQEPIGLCSGESEFYACVERRSSAAGNAIIDAGLESLPQAHSEDWDRFQCSQGLCSQTRPGTPEACLYSFLLLQDKVSKGDLTMVKVGTAEQLADFLTEPVTARWLAEKSPELGLEFREGRSSLQRGLVS